MASGERRKLTSVTRRRRETVTTAATRLRIAERAGAAAERLTAA
jgi:hypothetical protein